MAISDKLTYLNTTKGKIKDTINLTGANILSEDTFRSYANKLKQGLVDAINDGGSTIYSNFPKTTGEGTEITLNNTYAAPMRTTLKGNTEQDTLTGKNLLDTTIYNSTANVTILDKNNGVLDLEGVSGYYEGVSQSFDVTPNQNYVLSYNAQLIDTSVASACYVRIREKDDSTVIATNYNSGNQTISFTPTTDEINVFFRVNGETNKGHTKYSNIQLEQGTSKTSFEPYVGGIPSPNPDYPQPVKVVTGNNTINVCGKNLFDGIFRQGNRYTTGLTDTTRLFSTQNYPVKSGVIYTISTTLNTSVYKYAINLSTQIYPIPNTAEGNARQYYDSGWKQTNTFTFTPIKDGYLGIVVAKLNGTDTLTPSDISSSTWQLEVGSTATAYQPYQSKNYEISLKSKNLFDINNQTIKQDYAKDNNGNEIDSIGGNYTTSYTQVEPNTVYTFSYSLLSTVARIYYYTKDKTWISRTDNIINSNNNYTFTTPNNCYYIQFQNVINFTTSNNIQLEQGSSATEYEEFYDYKLCKIGTYQDYIYKENNKWYKHSEIGKIVLDGTETWGNVSSVVSGTTRFYTSNNSVYNSKNSTDTNIYILSNKFKGISWSAIYGTDTTTKNAISNYNNESSTGGRIVLRIDNNIASTIETLRTYLSNNNVTVYCVLETPTNTEITDTDLIEQLEELEKAKSVDGKTFISQINADLPFIISASALSKN